MKVYILAAIIAASSTLSNAAESPTLSNAAEMLASTKTTNYFHEKMTPRPALRLVCVGKNKGCEKDADCCGGFICISKKCE
jgi:hypothetical protein